MIYSFSDCRFEAETGVLQRAGQASVLRRRVADLLTDLIERRARWVAPTEILARLWRDARVTRSSVSTAMAELRMALGDDGDHQRIIRTKRGRGYRFVAPVALEESNSGEAYAARVCDAVATSAAAGIEIAMDRAERSLEAASRRGPRHLSVCGPEADAFAREWADIAADRGWQLHRGCRTDAACPALWPWWQVAASVREASEREGDAHACAEWTRIVAGIEHLASEPPHPSTPPLRQARFALLDGLSRALVRRAQARPLTVHLAGLDDADVDTRRVLAFVLATPATAPLWLLSSSEGPPPPHDEPPVRHTDHLELPWTSRGTGRVESRSLKLACDVHTKPHVRFA